MKKTLLLLFIINFLVLPCYATATVEINNYNQKDLKDTVAKYYIKQGIGVNVINDYSLVATKVYTGNGAVFASAFLYGANTNMHPELRYMYNFVQNGKNVLVSLTMAQINNAGTAVQTPIYLKPAEEVQALNQLKAFIEGYYTFGFAYIQKKKYLQISQIFKDQPAEKSGLQEGSMIIAVNNKNVAEVSASDITKEFNTPEKILNLKVKSSKNAEPIEITIKGQFIRPLDNL